MSDSLWPHGPQHTRLLCPSLSPGVCSDPCPLSQGCHPTISSSACPLLLLPSIFPNIRVFSNESGSSHQVARVLGLQLQHQSFQWICRVDFLEDRLVRSPGSYCPPDLLFCYPQSLFSTRTLLHLCLWPSSAVVKCLSGKYNKSRDHEAGARLVY